MTQNDERVFDFKKNKNGNYIVKVKNHDGLQDKVKKVNITPFHLGVFVLSNSKRILNNFIHSIDGFFTNDFYYTDTDS